MEVRKGLDLIDRVPDELWNEVRDIVQETGIKTIPMEKKSKKAKWLSGEALQIAVKRREAKSKGEKERYKHLNTEVQRIARRDKKAFFSNQCKEIEEKTEWERLEISSRNGNIRPPDLPPMKSVCRSRSNSNNWIWNKRLVPNQERSTRLYIITLLI